MPIRGPRRWDGVDLLLLGLSLPVVYGGSMFGAALPSWIAAFSSTEAGVRLAPWALATPALFVAISSPLVGRAASKVSLSAMMCVASLLMVVSGGMGMLASTVWHLLATRAVMGLGVSGMLVGTTTLISLRHVGDDRVRWLGIHASTLAAGGVVGSILVGRLAMYGWQAPFLLHAIGIPSAVGSWWLYTNGFGRVVPNGPSDGASVPSDARASAEATWRDARPTLVTLLAFCLFGWIGLGLFFVSPLTVSTYVAPEFGRDAAAAGTTLAFLTLGVGISSLQARHLVRWTGFRWGLVVAYGLAALGMWAMTKAPTWGLVGAGLFVSGLGFGMVKPQLSSWLSELTPEAYRAQALGVLSAAYYVGTFTSPLVLMVSDDWRVIFGATIGILCVAASLFAVLGARRGRQLEPYFR